MFLLETMVQVIAPMAQPPVGFSFSPGGLLFPYSLGAAYALRDAGLLTPATPVGGSSAGAIVATALACEISEEAMQMGLARLVADVRGGDRLIIALRRQLELILPEDSPSLAAGRLTVCYRSVLPWPSAHLVTEWSSKGDLIDTVCASCNWPLFFSKWPLVWCRRSLAIDGYFALPRSRFGCPELRAERTVGVCCIPRMGDKVALDFSSENLIQPSAHPCTQLPVDNSLWFGWALKPAADDELKKMGELGREHAMLWVERERAAGRALVTAE